MAKKALITGVTGQDGSYLTELLLEKGYDVYGLQRRASLPNTYRIDHIEGKKSEGSLNLIFGDLSDSSNLTKLLSTVKPEEVYNLGAQSHVGISFENPEYTADVNALGPLRLLETLRNLDYPFRYYQASSSEMFGSTPPPQSEQTIFRPQSPYGLSKVFAFHATRIFREAYGMFASNGILFNHESPRRGINFVTRKITLGLARIKLGLQDKLHLGNMDAKRDWGYSKDYVEAIWRILQHHEPDDFVIATGEQHSVREFVEEAGKALGFEVVWSGSGLEEKGTDRKTGKAIVVINPQFFRPNEVDSLLGDPSKAHKVLGWKPKVTFAELARTMAEHDYEYALNESAHRLS